LLVMFYTRRTSKLYLFIVVVICPGHVERVPVDEARNARERLKVIGDCCREGFHKKGRNTGSTPVALQRRWGRTKESRGYLLKLVPTTVFFPEPRHMAAAAQSWLSRGSHHVPASPPAYVTADHETTTNFGDDIYQPKSTMNRDHMQHYREQVQVF
jgi:hypothetical protein